MTWVKTNYDFGVPWVTLVVGQREAVVEHFDLSKYGDDPIEIERAVLQLIERHRPDLAGCILIGIELSLHAMQWRFQVIHNNLPRVSGYGLPPSQNLRLCRCGKVIIADGQQWLALERPGRCRTELVCSEECSK